VVCFVVLPRGPFLLLALIRRLEGFLRWAMRRCLARISGLTLDSSGLIFCLWVYRFDAAEPTGAVTEFLPPSVRFPRVRSLVRLLSLPFVISVFVGGHSAAGCVRWTGLRVFSGSASIPLNFGAHFPLVGLSYLVSRDFPPRLFRPPVFQHIF